MKKKTSKKRSQTRKASQISAEKVEIQFRERKLKDAIKGLKHPVPIPGYKATLPGPPGCRQKSDRELELYKIRREKFFKCFVTPSEEKIFNFS